MDSGYQYADDPASPFCVGTKRKRPRETGWNAQHAREEQGRLESGRQEDLELEPRSLLQAAHNGWRFLSSSRSLHVHLFNMDSAPGIEFPNKLNIK